MRERGRFLVPVDGSEASLRAVQMAASLARATGGTIDLLHVSYFDEGTEADPDVPTWLPEILMPAKVSSEDVFRRAERELDGIVFRKHRRTGTPAETIISFAKEAKDSVIVMGGRGLSPVRGFLLGSVSQSVMESFEGTVLIVK
ncbi:universal stress protein [Selenomonas sp. TAMA-11512]|uniref:universal stress protein n=1 Tax=Selenomonas sp. TAMA-11512 TaxID=3095337 RepID=UPI00308E34FB|nr:universal stress protein [Selenomonas sp. TAMA-11512]